MELEDRDFVAEEKGERKTKAIFLFIMLVGLPIIAGTLELILAPWGEMSTKEVITNLSFSIVILAIYISMVLGFYIVYRTRFSK